MARPNQSMLLSKCVSLRPQTTPANAISFSQRPSSFSRPHVSLFSAPIATKLRHALHRRPSPLRNMRCSDSGSSSLQFEPDPSLTNDDLKPTTLAQRTFSGLELASLWVGLVVGVPSYYLAGSLVDLGMSWWQGIATVVAANAILLVPLVLTGHPGARYGISFPVLARSCFGIHGAHIPTLMRALVGCGWYGIESWIGGEAIFLLLPNSIKQTQFSHYLPWLGTSPLEFVCFLIFWVAQLAIVWRGIDGIRELEKYSTPFLILEFVCSLRILLGMLSNSRRLHRGTHSVLFVLRVVLYCHKLPLTDLVLS